MDQRTFQSWIDRFPSIVNAVMDASESDGEISSEIVKKIHSISEEPLGFELLATLPVDMYNCYISPSIYVVWSDGDGQIDDMLVRELYSSALQREELVDYMSWQEEVVSCHMTIEQPIGMYFKRYDVDHIIVVIITRNCEIKNLKITLYKLWKDFDLKFAVQEITAAFENGGWLGIKDLRSRFETGVGLGHRLEYSL
jgi:hypothetical protein